MKQATEISIGRPDDVIAVIFIPLQLALDSCSYLTIKTLEETKGNEYYVCMQLLSTLHYMVNPRTKVAVVMRKIDLVARRAKTSTVERHRHFAIFNLFTIN